MAYKKKKTFFYAGSQKLPDPKAETHHAPPGYNSGTVSTGNGGAGGGYKFSRFQRYNNDEEDSFNSEPPAAVIPVSLMSSIFYIFRIYIHFSLYTYIDLTKNAT